MVHTPFPYQEEGATFLVAHPRGLLADEMGVGKTGQALLAACRNLKAPRILTLTPANVRAGWVKALPSFIENPPEIRVMQNSNDTPLATGITVCSYDMAIREPMRSKLLAMPWDVLILDEGHYLKDHTSKRTKLVYGARCDGGPNSLLGNSFYCWPLTGTPTPNHAGELFPMLKAFGLYKGSYMDFIYKYCDVIDGDYGPKVMGTKKKMIPELKQMIQSCTLRRKWSEVESQRPELMTDVMVIDPSECDAELLAELNKVEKGATGKALLAWLKAEEREPLDDLEMAGYRRLTGLIKVKPIAARIAEELELGIMDKVLVFAHHRQVVENIAAELATYNPAVAYGGMTDAAKQRAFEKFKTDPTCRVLDANLLVAGAGVDGFQHVCSNIVFVESSWVPGDNDQAIRRLYRTGQKHGVRVRFPSVAGTLDDAMAEVQARKAADIENIFS